MYWCIIHIKSGNCHDLLRFFNEQQGIHAFLPMMEKWFSGAHTKEYRNILLFPDYLFIKADMSKEHFHQTYQDLFHQISRFAKLLEGEALISMDEEEQRFFERMFDENGVIRHSIGNIINSKLNVESGPLKGMEQQIKKIDRHKRIAYLDCQLLGTRMKAPLEVVNKV